MSVKEMFEELGYIDFNEDEAYLIYSKSFRLRLKEIKFNKLFKTIYCKGGTGEWETGVLDFYELKAINKQIEELGWNND